MEERKFKNIDFYLKIIPISIAVFLIINFLFNYGYFAFIGLKFISLLEIRDYYEGTAPLIFFTSLFFIGYFNVIIYSKPVQRILKFITIVSDIIRKDIILKIKCRFLLNNYKEMSFDVKRKFVLLQKDIKTFNSLNKKDISRSFIGFVLVLIIILFPIFHSYYLIFKYSKQLYFIFIAMYLILVYLYLFNKNIRKRFVFLVLIIPTMFLIFGCWAFLRDYKTSGSEVLLKDGNTYVLLRPITKGAILKTPKGLIFYTWDDIKCIKKETNIDFKIFS